MTRGYEAHRQGFIPNAVGDEYRQDAGCLIGQ